MKIGARSLATLAFAVVAACSGHESTEPVRSMRVGSVVGRLSQPDTTNIFESLQALAVAPDAQSIYVLDRLARRIYRIGVDGGILAAFGQRGDGPDEIADATGIRASQRGVWVVDGERGRFLLFSPDGELLETVQPNVPWTVGRVFAATAEALLFPDLSSFQDPENDVTPLLLARASVSDRGFVSLDNPPHLPAPFESESGMQAIMERQIGWQLIAVASDEVRLVLNRSRPAVWSVMWQGDRITEMRELRVPLQVQVAIRDILEADRPPPGAELRPITGVHSVNERLWVTTGGIQPRMLGFSVPSSASVVPTVLAPGALLGQERIRDGVVIGDRFIGITETEVLWAELVDLTGT